MEVRQGDGDEDSFDSIQSNEQEDPLSRSPRVVAHETTGVPPSFDGAAANAGAGLADVTLLAAGSLSPGGKPTEKLGQSCTTVTDRNESNSRNITEPRQPDSKNRSSPNSSVMIPASLTESAALRRVSDLSLGGFNAINASTAEEKTQYREESADVSDVHRKNVRRSMLMQMTPQTKRWSIFGVNASTAVMFDPQSLALNDATLESPGPNAIAGNGPVTDNVNGMSCSEDYNAAHNLALTVTSSDEFSAAENYGAQKKFARMRSTMVLKSMKQTQQDKSVFGLIACAREIKRGSVIVREDPELSAEMDRTRVQFQVGLEEAHAELTSFEADADKTEFKLAQIQRQTIVAQVKALYRSEIEGVRKGFTSLEKLVFVLILCSGLGAILTMILWHPHHREAVVHETKLEKYNVHMAAPMRYLDASGAPTLIDLSPDTQAIDVKISAGKAVNAQVHWQILGKRTDDL